MSRVPSQMFPVFSWRAVRRWVAVAVAATTAFVSAGCDTQPDSPDAVSWANSVCEALLPWMDEIDTLTGAASVAMTPDSSPGEAKNELLELLSGAADASREARDAVIAAGVPDVDNGQAIATRFADSLAGTRDAYQSAHDDLAALNAEEDGFYDEVALVMAELVDAYAAVPQVAALDSDELREGFETAPACG